VKSIRIQQKNGIDEMDLGLSLINCYYVTKKIGLWERVKAGLLKSENSPALIHNRALLENYSTVEQ